MQHRGCSVSGDNNPYSQISQLIATSVADQLDRPAAAVQRLVDRVKAGDQTVTVDVLVPVVEELLATIGRFTTHARSGGSSPAP